MRLPGCPSGKRRSSKQTPPLSTDDCSNNPLRYAQKAIIFHKILTDVFKAQPSRLVRVVASQSDNSWFGRTIIRFRDLASYTDALAIALYFGHCFFSAPTTSRRLPISTGYS
ncbi:MAG TPA: hypothetical protein VF637_14140 [Sphingomicrobium sp.]